MSCFSETFWVSDRYFGPKMAINEVSKFNVKIGVVVKNFKITAGT